MTATHQANMDALMERMNAILAGGGEKRTAQHDKDNTCDNLWLLGLINCEYLAAYCKAFSLARKGRQ